MNQESTQQTRLNQFRTVSQDNGDYRLDELSFKNRPSYAEISNRNNDYELYKPLILRRPKTQTFFTDAWEASIEESIRRNYIPFGPPERPSTVFPPQPRNVYVPLRR